MIEDLRFTNKKKTILTLAITLVVIAGLLTVASFFDLQISKILTKDSLLDGEYISSSSFALFFEAIGSCAMYIMIAIAGVIAFWYGVKSNKHKAIRFIYAFIGAVMVIVGFFMTFKDTFTYVGAFIGARLTNKGAENILIDDAESLAGSLYIQLICMAFAIPSALALIALWKKVKKEDNDRYVWWAYAIICTAVFYAIVHFVKGPVGRVRFRTMNYLNNFDWYTPWYEMNGKRNLIDLAGSDGSQIGAFIKTRYDFVGDACKSFPSGHTFSAGMVYTLLALPYLNEKFAKKNARFALWACCITYTGLVALSRIVAGAHYMSDVLVGGSLAFAGAMISREIFVCRGLHFKQLFAKASAPTVPTETTESDNTVVVEATIDAPEVSNDCPETPIADDE